MSPEKVKKPKRPFGDGKKFGMTNSNNMDLEEDEYGLHWEVQRDWSAPFFRRNTKKLYKYTTNFN